MNATVSTSDPAWLAVVVALASGVGALLATSIKTLFDSRAANQARRREQQQRDAETLGPVMVHLVEADPRRLTLNLRPDPAEQTEINSALGEQRDKLVGELLVMAAGHPDETVRESCRELSVAMHNSLYSAMWAVNDLSANRDIVTSIKVAEGDHEAARNVAERLLREIAAYGSGRSTKRAAPPAR